MKSKYKKFALHFCGVLFSVTCVTNSLTAAASDSSPLVTQTNQAGPMPQSQSNNNSPNVQQNQEDNQTVAQNPQQPADEQSKKKERKQPLLSPQLEEDIKSLGLEAKEIFAVIDGNKIVKVAPKKTKHKKHKKKKK